MMIVLLQGYDEALRITPYNAIGYGALVFVLAYIAYKLWNELGALKAEYKDDLDLLRAEKASQVDKMLEINSESIPILTNVINVLQASESSNKTIADQVKELHRCVEDLKKSHDAISDYLKQKI